MSKVYNPATPKQLSQKMQILGTGMKSECPQMVMYASRVHKSTNDILLYYVSSDVWFISIWLSSCCKAIFPTIKTLYPTGRLFEAQEVKETHKSHEALKTYNIHIVSPQGHMRSDNWWGWETIKSIKLPANHSGFFQDSAFLRGICFWDIYVSISNSWLIPVRNSSKVTGLVNHTWVESFVYNQCTT